MMSTTTSSENNLSSCDLKNEAIKIDILDLQSSTTTKSFPHNSTTDFSMYSILVDVSPFATNHNKNEKFYSNDCGNQIKPDNPQTCY